MSSNSGHAAPPHILFFMGHFNDIDHLVPVAYKLCESNRGRPVVLLTDPLYDIRGDYRLQYLQKRYGVPVMSAFRFHPIIPLLGWLVHLLTLPLGPGYIYRPRPFLFRAFLRVFYGKWWAKRVLNRYQPAAMVFEWAQPASGVPGTFVAAGQDRGIPSISLPHGMMIYTNELVNRQEQREGRITREYVNLFDRAVYQTYLHANRAVEEGVRPDKIAVLGSARYCDEWQRINLEAQPERFEPQKGKECTYRAVFMLPQWNYNADFDATIQTLRQLSAQPWLHLVLKPHTREVEARPAYLQEMDALPNVEVAGAVGSVALIRWAEAVIVVGSSIALEALLQGKPHLDPEYLHDNSTVFEEAGAEWTVHSDQELVDALKRLSGGQKAPYDEEQVSKVIAQLVLDGSGERDVLERYVTFILGGWREHPTYKDFLASPGSQATVGSDTSELE